MKYYYQAGVIVPFAQKYYKQLVLAVAAIFVSTMAVMGLSAKAATEVEVTPADMQGWTATTATGGSFSFVNSTGGLGDSSLQLNTTSDTASRVKLAHETDLALSEVSTLGYWTDQLSAADVTNGNATMRVSLDLDGDGDEDDQLMFEPYYNGFNGNDPAYADWNYWDLMTGKFWSNYQLAYNGLGGAVGAGSYASNFTLQDVLTEEADARVIGISVTMGTWNVSQSVLVDGVTLNDTVYNFERAENMGTITAPTAGEEVTGELVLGATYEDYTEGDSDAVQWAVRSGTCDAGLGAVAGNVDGFNNPYTWTGSETFSATLDTSSWADGSYCFVFNPTDDAGENNVREKLEFTVRNNVLTKEQCKDGGWSLGLADGRTFRNQGDCVSHFASANQAANNPDGGRNENGARRR